MPVEERKLYLRGGSRPKIEPYLNMLEFMKVKHKILPEFKGG